MSICLSICLSMFLSIGIGLCGSVADASEGGDQFAKLLDRLVTIDSDDITVDDAYGSILENAHPKDDLPRVNGCRGSTVGREVLERHVSLHLKEVTVGQAFAALVAATDGAIEFTWSEPDSCLTMGLSVRARAEAQARFEERQRRWRKHLDDTAVMIGKAERITVSRLGKMDEKATDGFPIVPYDTYAVVMKRLELDQDASQPFLEALSAMVAAPEGGSALCHDPAWGLEVFAADGAMVFRTSVCFHCMNYYVEIEQSAQWAAMPGGVVEARLKDLLTALLP